MCGKLLADGRFSAASGSGVPHHGGAMAPAAGPATVSAAAATSVTGSQRRNRRRKVVLLVSRGRVELLPASLHGLGGPRRVLASSSMSLFTWIGEPMSSGVAHAAARVAQRSRGYGPRRA